MQPALASQKSLVQGFSSLHAVAVLAGQPASPHTPSWVHALSSSQLTTPEPTHAPIAHTSPAVHASPSSQSPALSASNTHPSAATQSSAVHASPSSHTIASKAHFWFTHPSTVHADRSSHCQSAEQSSPPWAQPPLASTHQSPLSNAAHENPSGHPLSLQLSVQKVPLPTP